MCILGFFNLAKKLAFLMSKSIYHEQSCIYNLIAVVLLTEDQQHVKTNLMQLDCVHQVGTWTVMGILLNSNVVGRQQMKLSAPMMKNQLIVVTCLFATTIDIII